jgi:hypothetical protein
MQQNVKLTKSNKLTGHTRQHEFRMVDIPETTINNGKCCGVSNVKGNSHNGPCKYDVKLTDIEGAQVSLGRISGNNSLQIANLMVASLLRGDYKDDVNLDEIQHWCKTAILEAPNTNNVADAGCQSECPQTNTEYEQVDIPHTNIMCDDQVVDRQEENLQARPAHVLVSEVMLQRKQIRRLKRRLNCLETDSDKWTTFTKGMVKLCKSVT